MANEETTTRFTADIGDLKQAMQDARRAVRLADSEFKATVSTLEDWSSSADGVSAKIKQLNSNVQSQEKILNSLEQQYAAVVEEQGESSKAAEELLIKINKQKAVVNQTTATLQKYEAQLGQIVAEQQKMESETEKQISTYDKLKETISQQESELESLKKEYSNTALEQGKTSDAAQELAGRIERLSNELKVNKDLVNKADKAADELDDSLDDVGDAAKEASDGFTVMKGAIASLIADGFKALASAAKDSLAEIVMETGKAYDAFQGKTGTSTEAMGEFEDAINNLYRGNYGESVTDIANAMAEVKQQTQETDPSKLQELTKNALILRDTFEFDVQESMRAVNMLMDQFGISGDEAYNLIVQGAQKGLNKNGDLLDTINEYGVHYKQLGYDSDDFFNSLVNGAGSGTFSVDKLGDAVKEFGIRVKDTASSTDEGFELVGLNANKMRKEFAKGGESAQKATEKTLKALFDMKDEVKQNQAGVALFGTMWEDLGVEGVKALMNTNGELTKTKQSMKELDAVSYDNVASKFEQIGRTVKMDLLLPLAEDAIPTIEKFADTAIENSDAIVSALKTIGTVAATVFVVNKVATFTQSIFTMVDAYKKAKTAIQGADAAQKLFNITQSATPWGAIATAIGLVVAGLVAYGIATKDAKSESDKMLEAIDESNKKIREQAEAYQEVEQARLRQMDGIESEYGYYQRLSDELANITDKNGKVKKGYESRAEVITGILSKALGEEINTDKLVADGKQKIIDKINKLIEVKKAEAMLAAQEKDYTDALKNSTSAYEEYLKKKEDAKKVSEELAKAEKELEKASKDTSNSIAGGAGAYGAASVKVGELRKKQEETNKAVTDAQEVYLGYQNTIATYEGVSAAIIEGDSAKINEALLLMTNGFKTAENSTRESLEAQVTAAQNNLALLQQALKDGEPGITQQMVDNAQKMVERSVAELDKLAPQASVEGAEGGQAFADGVESTSGESEKAGKSNADAAVKGESQNTDQSQKAGEQHGDKFKLGVESFKTPTEIAGELLAQNAVKGEGSKMGESQTKGSNLGNFFSVGIASKKGDALASGTSLAENATEGEGSKTGESQTKGVEFGQTFASGIDTNQGTALTSGTSLAEKAKDGAGSVDSSTVGGDFADGFGNGMEAKEPTIWQKAWNLGKKALSALKEAIDSNSPAKETIDIGEFFGEGFEIGIENFLKDIGKSSENLGEVALDNLADVVEKSGVVGRNLAQEFAKGIEEGSIEVEKATSKMVNKALNSDDVSEKFREAAEKGKEEYINAVQNANREFRSNGGHNQLWGTGWQTKPLDELLKEFNVDDMRDLSLLLGPDDYLRALVDTNYQAEMLRGAHKFGRPGHTTGVDVNDYTKENGQVVRSLKFWLDGKESGHHSFILGDNPYVNELDKIAVAAKEKTKETTQTIKDGAKEQTSTIVNTASEWLSKQQKNNKLSLADEVAYWDEIRKQCAEGTAERIAAEEKYIEAKTKLDEKLIDATDTLKDSLTAIYEKVEERKQSILDSFDLFGDGKSADDFFLRMYGQVAGLEDYQKEINKLESRIGGTGLYEALKSMGLNAHGQLVQINSMTDHALQEYVKLFDKRSEIAENLALDELGNEIINGASTAAETYADELVGTLGSSSADLFEVGEDVAYSFGESLLTGIGTVLQEVKSLITSTMGDLANTNISATANGILADLKGKIGSATANISGVTVSGSGGSSTVNNYTQIINSPKTLSRTDIYRSTKNLLGLAGGGK